MLKSSPYDMFEGLWVYLHIFTKGNNFGNLFASLDKETNLK